ncbi:hypothetical protein AaE_001019, partial [Aphanomyces astaci]
GVVDPLSGLEDKGTVLQEDDVVWSVMLNQTDVSYGVKGHNKFYSFQIIIDNDDGHQAYVFFRWGRVGAKNPQVKRAPFPINQTLHVILLQRKLHGPFTKDAAKELFVSKFTAKTENDWPVTPPFEPVKGKYTLIELDYSEGDDNSTTMMEAETAKNNPEQGAAEVVPPSTLPVSVQTFVKLICDVDLIAQEVAEMHLDLKRMPLGKLSKSHLAKGYVILDFISDTLTTIADLNAASKQVEGTSSTPRHRRRSSRVIKSTASSTTKAQLAKCKAQLKDWTSEFYTNCAYDDGDVLVVVVDPAQLWHVVAARD